MSETWIGWLDPAQLRALGVGLAAAGVGAAAGLVAAWLAGSAARHWGARVRRAARGRLSGPLALAGAAFMARLATPVPEPPPPGAEILQHALQLILIGAVGWSVTALLAVTNAALNERYVLQEKDNLVARRILTRFRVLRRIAVVVVVVLTFSAMVMTFPDMRHLGAGILASAGVAGIVLGIAIRPTAETLLAGVQLALTHPINIDDVVIVEGEWGRIEEITTTYVVVRIWDKRRLIVPIADFIQKPFQNWTRVTADLLGAVTVEVDYRTPVDEVRRAVGEMLEGCELWNREFWNLQVVDAGERSMSLRVLVSAGDADNAWTLRCHLREWLIGWLQREHPECLPRLRAELRSSEPAGQPA